MEAGGEIASGRRTLGRKRCRRVQDAHAVIGGDDGIGAAAPAVTVGVAVDEGSPHRVAGVVGLPQCVDWGFEDVELEAHGGVGERH